MIREYVSDILSEAQVQIDWYLECEDMSIVLLNDKHAFEIIYCAPSPSISTEQIPRIEAYITVYIEVMCTFEIRK